MTMMNRLLFSLLLLLIGVNMQAQSVAAEQMDERFNDGKMPYGWFGEGWTVKDGAAQKASDDGGMGMPGMGGGSSFNYLLTPPLQVQEGEKIVFSAKKGEDSGMGSMMGGSDSTFVVERSVYSERKWVKVADFTESLTAEYQNFTIDGTPAGEYRFRFRAAGNVCIDSVAGHHIDMAAPDIYIVRDSVAAKNVDLGLCAKDTTTTFYVVNTATGTLQTAISVYDDTPFVLNKQEVAVAAGDSIDVDLTFVYADAKKGRNTTVISFKPSDDRVYGEVLYVDAIVAEDGVWQETFNGEGKPKGWFTEGWQIKDNTASIIQPSDGMEGMMGGGASLYYLMTPVLTIQNPLEVLAFSARTTGDSGMGSFMGGGGGSTFVLEKSLYGSNKWEKVKDFSEKVDTVFTTLWASEMQEGDYRFRFVATDSIVIDSVAGFHLKENCPDLYVTVDSMEVQQIKLGMLNANMTKTFMVINTGNGTLHVNVASSDESVFSTSAKELDIAAGDTAKVEVTFIFNSEKQGVNEAVIAFIPTSDVLQPRYVYMQAYTTYAEAWEEDFEPEYVVDDETQPLELPVGWETTGWTVSKPSGGGMMEMFGMGGGEEKSWMATTDSETYELITPRLQAKKGDVLQFTAEMSGGGLPIMAMMGGGGSGMLQVYYQREHETEWTLYDVFTQGGTIYIEAPYAGVYRLKFKSPGVSLDNFKGFFTPMEEVALVEGEDANNTAMLEKYDGIKVNVTYDRTLSAVYNSDDTWSPKAYTICLPYDWNVSDYMANDMVKLYQLAYIDKYYKQFIFTECADMAEAGKAYLAVVEKGSVSMNAANVTIKKDIAETDAVIVNDYEKWYFDKEQTKVGTWQGTFSKITAESAADKYIYCLREDGSWGRLVADESDPTIALSAFRGYMQADEEMTEDYSMNPLNDGAPHVAGNSFQTMFGIDGEVTDQPNLLFVGDIPIMQPGTTGVKPLIETIDADGTHRYYDLMGRQMKEKAQTGITIENGKKTLR